MAETSVPTRSGPRPKGVVLRLRRSWRSRVLAHRRGLVAVCVGVAVLATVRTLAPPPAPTDEVWVATRDLPAGVVLTSGDLTPTAYARGTAPDGVVPDAAGETLASPLRRGEPVTDVRLLTPDLMTGHPDRVALPVRVTDPAAVDLVRVGDRVDLLSTDPAAGTVTTVARAATVVALPADEPGSHGGATAGRVVVVALEDDEVEPVTVAAVRQFLSVAWSR